MDMPSVFRFNRQSDALLPLIFCTLIVSLSSASSVAADVRADGDAQRIDRAAQADPARIAIDGDGNAIAVWTQFDALPSRVGVWTNRYLAHRGWGIPKLINDSPEQANDVRIAMNTHGDAIAVWTQYNNGTPFKANIWANRYSKANGWEHAQEIEDDHANAYAAKIGIDANGNAIAVWTQNDAAQDRTHIFANRYTVGAGWAKGVPIQSDVTATANEPQLAMDADGNATAVWTQYAAPQSGIWTNRLTRTNGWAVAQNIGDASASLPVVAIDNRGGAMAAWLQPDIVSNQNNVYARHYADGRWDSLALVQGNTQADARMLQLAMNARGNVVALWQERQVDYGAFSGFSSAVYANDYGRARGWATAQRIDDSTEYTNASLAIDNNDNVIAAWERDNTAQVTQNIYVYRHAWQHGWDSGVRVGRVQDNAGYPQLAASDRGTTALVWQLQDSSGNSALWGDVFATAALSGAH